ncbi:MAG: thiamine pyrophosphate-binding protein, partial [Firmicutes bacterium]|nr:thiamine pyrophosphate-binding protein [Bacillota bacterium]
TADTIEYTSKAPYELRKNPQPDGEVVKRIAQLINEAERPVIYFGGGVTASDAGTELNRLLEKADIPATYTLMGAGVVGSDNPHSLGMLGMHGSVSANRAVNHADLLIALGARFSDRVALNPGAFAKNAKRVQIDIDKSEIGKNVPVDEFTICDVREFLYMLLPLIKEQKREAWAVQIQEWKDSEKIIHYEGEGACQLHPDEIVMKTCELTDKDTIYVTDVGQHQIWAAQYVKHEKTRRFITSGGLGTMGFGYGAAIGSQLGNPDKRVIHFTGDGSFHMNLNEACTAVSNNLPIITIIMNNSVLGMVYQWQTLFYEKRFSNTTPERKTDFVKLAQAFGAEGYRATTPEEFEEAMKKALQADGPVWIDCIISREERVLPMIPGGKTVEDMIID